MYAVEFPGSLEDTDEGMMRLGRVRRNQSKGKEGRDEIVGILPCSDIDISACGILRHVSRPIVLNSRPREWRERVRFGHTIELRLRLTSAKYAKTSADVELPTDSKYTYNSSDRRPSYPGTGVGVPNMCRSRAKIIITF
jgi:hypothetical protein